MPFPAALMLVTSHRLYVASCRLAPTAIRYVTQKPSVPVIQSLRRHHTKGPAASLRSMPNNRPDYPSLNSNPRPYQSR